MVPLCGSGGEGSAVSADGRTFTIVALDVADSVLVTVHARNYDRDGEKERYHEFLVSVSAGSGGIRSP